MRVFAGVGTLILIIIAGADAMAAECVDCVIPARAAEAVRDNGIAVWTDKFGYDKNTMAAIRGYSDTDEPITIVILNPMGNIAAVNQDMPTESGFFEIVVSLSGPYWEQEGHYSVMARAGPDSTPHIIHIRLGVIGCGNAEISVDAGAEGVHCIAYEQKGDLEVGIAALNTHTNALTVETSGVGQGSLELQIPRYLLDSQTGETDAAFVVIGADGDMIEYNETVEQEHRTITIEYPPAAYGTIEIRGTEAIPEFGAAIAAMAAALAMPLGWRLIKIHK